ncbi:MAG: GTP-binding protein [Asgard group archaeon]|nr:GTP-binding protein [Asgard group archaeon]
MRLLAKVVLAGDGGVGKTTLIHRYITNSFIDSTKLTIGAAFHTHEIETRDHSVLVQIWDLGGQEQFKQMGIFDKYFKGATVTVIMFDLTRLNTLSSIPEWADLALNSSNTKLILVGGKKDLAQGVSFELADFEELNEKYNFDTYLETSSATGEGVDEVFQAIADVIIDTTIEKKLNGPKSDTSIPK